MGDTGRSSASRVEGHAAGARYGEIWGDTGRYGEIWGDMGRSSASDAPAPNAMPAPVLGLRKMEPSTCH